MSDERDIDEGGRAPGPHPNAPGGRGSAAVPRVPPVPSFAPPKPPGRAAGSPRASTGAAAPPPIAPVVGPPGGSGPLPPTVASPSRPEGVGLPPPPEFQARSGSAEDTLMGIPPLLLGEPHSDVIDVRSPTQAPAPTPPPASRTGDGGDVAVELDDFEQEVTIVAPRASAAALREAPAATAAPSTPAAAHRETPAATAAPRASAAAHRETPAATAAPSTPAAAPRDEPRSVAPPSEADGGLEVDVDVSDETLLLAAALREPIPSPSLAPAQVPTAPVAALGAARAADAPVPRTTRPSSRARQARPLEAIDAEPRRPLGLWLGVGATVGAVISIAAILWSTSHPTKDATPETADAAIPISDAKADDPATAEGPTKADPEPVPPAAGAKPEPSPDALADAPPPSPDALADAPPPAPDAGPAEEPSSDASVVTVEPDRSEYQRARAEYEATGSQKALLAMTTAACALEDGPRARAAFRKLVGKTPRTKAMAACRALRVDVTASVDGYTGRELLDQARDALAAGDARTALDKAHASNKVERSSEAVLVKALAACTLGDRAHAQRLVPHVSIKARPRLVEGCKQVGVELRS